MAQTSSCMRRQMPFAWRLSAHGSIYRPVFELSHHKSYFFKKIKRGLRTILTHIVVHYSIISHSHGVSISHTQPIDIYQSLPLMSLFNFRRHSIRKLYFYTRVHFFQFNHGPTRGPKTRLFFKSSQNLFAESRSL